jgi:hypothetical protein
MPTVLVIDDDPATADALRRVAPSDWTVATAPDGVAGLDMVRRRAPMPDVVVLDVQMPHDGVLTALQLRRQHPNLPIVPCTAFPEFLGVLADRGPRRRARWRCGSTCTPARWTTRRPCGARGARRRRWRFWRRRR